MQGVQEMRDSIEVQQVMLIMKLLAGDPTDAMEAAKGLIGIHDKVEPELLVQILQNRRYHLWSRIAASYALGFLHYLPKGVGTLALMGILENTNERVSLRSHAAEALGNLGAREATGTLERALFNKNESIRLQRWCIFALSELHSNQAMEVLRRFDQSRPKGVLRSELQMALER